MPLAAGTLGDCRMCREHREVGDLAMHTLHHGSFDAAVGISEEWAKQMEGHSCQAWVDSSLMPPKRGRWLSVRLELGVYDWVLREYLRIPIARADALALGDPHEIPSGFHVFSTPGDDTEGRIAHYFLNRLDKEERVKLLSDLKEV